MSSNHSRNKKKRKTGSTSRKARKKGKRPKRTDVYELYTPGDYVSWADEESDYIEGLVLHDSPTCLSVMTKSHRLVRLDRASRLRAKCTNWRDTVCLGDIVEYYTPNRDWIFCKVRGIQWPPGKTSSSSPIVVIEPVFVGYCISVPLVSLMLRKIPRLPPEIIMLQQSGFAFLDKNIDEINWPSYNPNGCPSLFRRGHQPVAEDYNTFRGTTLYKLRSHPIVPPGVCLVRDSHGSLSYKLEIELGERCGNSKLHLPEPVCMGTLSLSFDDMETTDQSTVAEFCNGMYLARKHFNLGHFASSASCALEATVQWEGVQWKGEGTEKLAKALLNEISVDPRVPSP
mgnify:CR=1 FL=1